MSDIFNDVIIN